MPNILMRWFCWYEIWRGERSDRPWMGHWWDNDEPAKCIRCGKVAYG